MFLLRTIMVALLVVAPVAAEEAASQLSVRGEAILKVPADQASLRIVIRAEADTVAEAMRSAGTRINKITDFLDSLDIEPGKERRTGGYSLEPIWSQRPRNPAEDWKPTVLGHRMEQRILIETTRLELVGELLAKSAKHGADEVNLDGFGLSKAARMAQRDALLQEAVRNARREARVVSASSGSVLTGIKNIDIESDNARPPVMARGRMMMSAEADFGAPTIEAGEVEVRAAVRIVYTLGPLSE